MKNLANRILAAPEFIARYQQAAGAHARVAVLSVVGGRGFTKRLSVDIGGIMISTVYPSPWNTSKRVIRDFQAAMAKTNRPITLQSLEGCINLRLMVEALKRAGKNPTSKSLQQALRRGMKLDLGGFVRNLPSSGQTASTYTSLGYFGLIVSSWSK